MKYNMLKYISTQLLLFISIFMLVLACKETDDVAPIITLVGADSLDHVLNQAYNDEGATAYDETDGDITNSIYVDNSVDENLFGEYYVTYLAVDQAGNEASSVSRYVKVINSAWPYIAYYNVVEHSSVFPELDSCKYTSSLWVDSTLNYRIEFTNFACEDSLVIFADITDSIIVVPYQLISDSLRNFSLQGSGSINDSSIFIEYKKTDSISSYRTATFTRL